MKFLKIWWAGYFFFFYLYWHLTHYTRLSPNTISPKHQISFFSFSFINSRQIKGTRTIHRIQTFKWKHIKASSVSLARSQRAERSSVSDTGWELVAAARDKSGILTSVPYICHWLCDLWSIYKMKIIILAFSGGWTSLVTHSYMLWDSRHERQFGLI